MAHEFESGFFVAKGAWHGLGKTLQQAPTTKDAVVQAGLDWQVIEKPCDENAETTAPSQQKQLIRDCDEKVLGTVDRDYIPLQNQDAFRWFDPLVEKGGMSLEAAGSLQGGKRVWVLAKISRTEGRVGLNDLIHSYLLLHNSHDGSTAVWLQFTPIRVVCMNTLSGAASRRFQDLWEKRSACIPHTASLPEQMARVQSLIDLNKLEFQMSVEEYQAMADQEANEDLLSTYLGNVLETVRPRQRPEWPQLLTNFERGRGNRGRTLWDAYNAVTEWIDHQQEVSAEQRLLSSWFGAGAALRKKAHREAISLVQKGSASRTAYDRRQRIISDWLKRKTLTQELQESISQLSAGKNTPYNAQTETTLADRIKSLARD